MPLPETARVEVPILQELEAVGGSDALRYLYDRLLRYFPQLTAEELTQRSGRSPWKAVVQRAGRQLFNKGELRRAGARWSLTAQGRRRVEAEAMRPVAVAGAAEPPRPITHREAQEMLVQIGQLLGRHAEAEFEYYDVVWRDGLAAPRLSHVFEVQIAGSVDSALARLKHAYDAQRSRLFLVIADERAARFADRRLTGSFHEIWKEVTVIGIAELKRLYESLSAQRELLEKLIAKT